MDGVNPPRSGGKIVPFVFTTSLIKGSPDALLARLSFVCPKSLSRAAASVWGARARQELRPERGRTVGGRTKAAWRGVLLSEPFGTASSHLSVIKGSRAGKDDRGVSCSASVYVHTVFVRFEEALFFLALFPRGGERRRRPQKTPGVSGCRREEWGRERLT